MADEWFYSQGGNRVGPVSAAQLRQFAESGTITPDDWVWKQGMQDWIPARRINGLFPQPADLSVMSEEPRHVGAMAAPAQGSAPAPGNQPEGFGFQWYLVVWKKFADPSGRARRMEYWTFLLFHYIVIILLMIAGRMANGSSMIVNLYALAAIVPTVMVRIRRLHDIGKSGWWLLISIVPIVGWIIMLIFLTRASEPGTNKYGPNPLGQNA
ncbi:MAG TPA: DUF805 domain-containing protein [Pirellulales bacterium]|jgi:uncharacterized membrane protein YhaH (DUF805 family)